jgi:Calcineurin-like phosphoesterase
MPTKDSIPQYPLIRWWSRRLTRMAIGSGFIALGLMALVAPFAVGTWSLQFLSLPMLAVGVTDLYRTAMRQDRRGQPASYATGFLAVVGALLLYLSPSLVATGVVAMLLVLLAIDGALKAGQTFTASTASRTVSAVNAAFSLIVALIGWWLWQKVGLEFAIGLMVGGFTVAAGWRMLVSPMPPPGDDHASGSSDLHPYARLGLGRHELFAAANRSRAESISFVAQTEFYWFVVAALVMFATHLGRMRSADTWLGLISPLVATAGDLVMAALLGGLLVLPLRLALRRLSIRLERRAWRLRLSGADAEMHALPRRLIRKWTDARLAFAGSLRDARSSLLSAAGVVLRLGLPLAVLLAAMNPIWGFTWYFNTESWASAFYQKMTELRVDNWRAAMIDRIRSVHPGVRDDLFQVRPSGIETDDFAFIVIGDPGEGDASQYALVNRYLEIGKRDDVKFLVVASDVIYPAGAMEDYERNFYLPFHGFTKPIYAIPGNHDWFDALEGFSTNFLEPEAARAALAARVEADFRLTSTSSNRIDRIVERARRLREFYGIQAAGQRAPFFEIQTSDFALIAIDTGIRRTLDERQRVWLSSALERARGKFTMVIPGHPRYAAGVDTSVGDAEFSGLFATLERAGVDVIMAGDTHAFEYYVDYVDGRNGVRPVYHFVNGGGGAYLSIGGALGWPDEPPTQAWAFYPAPEAVRAKLDAETPWWKWPMWAWTRRFGTWPVSTETLSGMFDFNHAPFYQSFVEVRVERSKRRVVFALHGVSGAVRWRDMHASFKRMIGAGPDDPVELVASMRP